MVDIPITPQSSPRSKSLTDWEILTANLPPAEDIQTRIPPDSDLDSDEEYAAQVKDAQIKPKQGGYDSRIEQILHENPKLPILIVDAGKSSESGGKYIVYTIRTGVGFTSLIVRDGRLQFCRSLRFEGDILNSLHFEMHSQDSTQP